MGPFLLSQGMLQWNQQHACVTRRAEPWNLQVAGTSGGSLPEETKKQQGIQSNAKGKKKGPKGKRSGRPHRARDSQSSDYDEDLNEAEFRKKVQTVFHLPISEAAYALGVGVTVLKKQCRQINIPRWPYRSLPALRNSLKALKRCLPSLDTLLVSSSVVHK